MNKVKYAMLSAGTILLENQNTCKTNQAETMKEALRIISEVLHDTEKESLESELKHLKGSLEFYVQEKMFDCADGVQKEIEKVEASLTKLKENK